MEIEVLAVLFTFLFILPIILASSYYKKQEGEILFINHSTFPPIKVGSMLDNSSKITS